ncbi:MAG: hypothetical protein PHQ98_02850 [Candidatus ainarchaeum sp.]|nr:hypothetical protein [Candidatus ainarchaeum sp.]
MDFKKIMILFFSLSILFISFIIAFFLFNENQIIFNFSTLPLTFITLAFFIFGIVAFGYLSFIPSILIGVSFGSQKNILLLLYLVPITLASFAGISLGQNLKNDFDKKDVFFKNWKSILILIIIALIISISIDLFLPTIINLIPQLDFFNDSGQTTGNFFENLFRK